MSKFKIRQQAIIINKNKVLLLKYSDHSKEAGKWDFPGGHLQLGEFWKEGIQREIKEETGLRVAYFDPIRVYNNKDTYIVFFKSVCDKTEIALSNEHSNYLWFDINNPEKLDFVRQSIVDDIKNALKKSLD